MSNIKQAVILCAGLGTRLRPITDTIPKPMLPILGKPLLEWNIEQFKKHGVVEFFINLHYLPEAIKNYFGDGSKLGVKINYFLEKNILGTAGGIKSFENQLDDVFFLIYGDMISLVDYSRMTNDFFGKSDAIGMQRMQKTDNYADADVAELADDGSYLKIHPKPHTEHYSNAYRMKGIFILKKDILNHIPPDTFYELGKNLLPEVVSKGKKFYSYECDDYSKGIDTEDKWREVEEYLKKSSA
ncbi:MAG: nucleotidyltransferase [Parcubacteria group bacterium Gr01-1014_19]|nr:MAG: nucleotidyltransferase [Parcubacteria group bacterium Gr01-1014_19]